VVSSFQTTEGAVKSLSFSSDLRMGVSLLASTSSEGQITLFDLNKKQIHSVLRKAHGGKRISHLSFISGEPILISSSGELNSLKMWFFEPGLIQPRLLKERCGHSGAPTKLRFYGGQDESVETSSRHLISAAEDGNLRDISLLNEFQSMNFSKKNLAKISVKREDGQNIGTVSDFAFTEFRESDWSNLLTSHSEAKSPFLWQYADHAMSKVPVLASEKNVQVTAVCVTQCGNFGILGFANGQI